MFGKQGVVNIFAQKDKEDKEERTETEKREKEEKKVSFFGENLNYLKT